MQSRRRAGRSNYPMPTVSRRFLSLKCDNPLLLSGTSLCLCLSGQGWFCNCHRHLPHRQAGRSCYIPKPRVSRRFLSLKCDTPLLLSGTSLCLCLSAQGWFCNCYLSHRQAGRRNYHPMPTVSRRFLSLKCDNPLLLSGTSLCLCLSGQGWFCNCHRHLPHRQAGRSCYIPKPRVSRRFLSLKCDTPLLLSGTSLCLCLSAQGWFCNSYVSRRFLSLKCDNPLLLSATSLCLCLSAQGWFCLRLSRRQAGRSCYIPKPRVSRRFLSLKCDNPLLLSATSLCLCLSGQGWFCLRLS